MSCSSRDDDGSAVFFITLLAHGLLILHGVVYDNGVLPDYVSICGTSFV